MDIPDHGRNDSAHAEAGVVSPKTTGRGGIECNVRSRDPLPYRIIALHCTEGVA